MVKHSREQVFSKVLEPSTEQVFSLDQVPLAATSLTQALFIELALFQVFTT